MGTVPTLCLEPNCVYLSFRAPDTTDRRQTLPSTTELRDPIETSPRLGEVAERGANDFAVLQQSSSQGVIENLLKVYYEPLEVWFLRMSIEKASNSTSVSS